MGGDLCFEGCGFKSRHRILAGHFSHIFVVKILINVCLKSPKINDKRGRGWPIFLKISLNRSEIPFLIQSVKVGKIGLSTNNSFSFNFAGVSGSTNPNVQSSRLHVQRTSFRHKKFHQLFSSRLCFFFILMHHGKASVCLIYAMLGHFTLMTIFFKYKWLYLF